MANVTKTAKRATSRGREGIDLDELIQRHVKDPNALEEMIRERVLELNLQELRAITGKSQYDMAEAIDASQSQLSKLEARQDHLVSTLRRYVEALGGRLEVRAVFGNKEVVLQNV